MGSISQLLNTARDGLSAQSYGLGVTGQNIANVNTPGYVRREAMLETRALGSQTTGTVQAVGLRRVTDAFLQRRQYEATGLTSAASEHDRRLASAEALFNDASGTGLSSAVGALFSSFSQLAANPSDPTARRNVLDSAAGFSQRVSDTADTLAEGRADLLRDAQATTGQINESARGIARLNGEISSAEAQGEDAADLKDQRNRLLMDLATLVDVKTINSGGGSGSSMVVQVSGTTLVDGSEARTLGVDLDSDGSLRIMASREGGQATEVTKFLSGGKLAGIRETRDVDLVAISKKLDDFAFDVSTAINQQHQQGFGLDGSTGRDLFAVNATAAGAARSLKVSGDVLGKPEALGASGSAGTVPGGSDNAALLSALGSAPIVFGGSRSAAQAYGDIVGDVGSRRSSARSMLESREAIGAQITAMHEAVSGVSLDEEFVNLTKFQRAYEASARVLTVADELLQQLINTIGR
jgi:flagellar hook-associated protein 1 FlgK